MFNWQAHLLQCGYKKLSVHIVMSGLPGCGKNCMWELFFGQGIIGRGMWHVIDDLRHFQSNFNAERLNKCLHIFNECTSILSGTNVNWDKMKALSDPTFRVEKSTRKHEWLKTQEDACSYHSTERRY